MLFPLYCNIEVSALKFDLLLTSGLTNLRRSCFPVLKDCNLVNCWHFEAIRQGCCRGLQSQAYTCRLLCINCTQHQQAVHKPVSLWAPHPLSGYKALSISLFLLSQPLQAYIIQSFLLSEIRPFDFVALFWIVQFSAVYFAVLIRGGCTNLARRCFRPQSLPWTRWRSRTLCEGALTARCEALLCRNFTTSQLCGKTREFLFCFRILSHFVLIGHQT